MSTVKTYSHEPAFNSGLLPVGSMHKLHYEQYGNKEGRPVVFLHGGPGGGTSIYSASFFDPAVYRVVIFDQRGCGRSLPLGELRENTLQDLVSDIEVLRSHLGIDKWHMVFGGSFGSTLALAYAQAHPNAVGSLIIRGVWLMSKEEFDFTLGPVKMLFPEVFERFYNHLPPEDRSDPLSGYHKLLTSGDRAVESAAAKMYNLWAVNLIFLNPPPELLDESNGDDARDIPSAQVNAHYMVNQGFMPDGGLLKPENMKRIEHIPTGIVNGRWDVMCPPAIARRVYQALPKSKLYIVPDAGHAAEEPGIKAKLIELCDEFGKLDV